MPFSSVVVWSWIAASAHAASAHADSEVESHIAFFSTQIPSQLLLLPKYLRSGMQAGKERRTKKSMEVKAGRTRMEEKEMCSAPLLRDEVPVVPCPGGVEVAVSWPLSLQL